MGLYLRDLRSGETRRLDDKASGATAAFTPDSRTVIYSAIERRRLFYSFSELEAYDIELNRHYVLTSRLRARDPDISADGKWITFTITENQTTTLALAPLEREGDSGRLKLGEVRRLAATTLKYDRVGTPRFARDGNRILYSIHHNGRLSEELMSWNFATGEITELVADGKFNRYPAPAPDGSVYFISDRTGVNNLYRLNKAGLAELVTNVVSGLSTPAVGPQGELYASIYATRGWSVARLEPMDQSDAAALKLEALTLDPPLAPPYSGLATSPPGESSAASAAIGSYSLFPSIWPRQWNVIPQLYPGGAYFQASLAGFDAVDRHEYAAAVGINTQIADLDWSASYANRSLGPTLNLAAAHHTTSFAIDPAGVTDYTRKHQYGIKLSQLIRWTYSSLTPVLGLGAEQIFTHARGADPNNDDLLGVSPFVPTADAALYFSDAERSRLSVAPEGGRALSSGVRLYSNTSNSEQTWKGAFKGTQYLRLWQHSVLIPSLKGQLTSNFDSAYGDANASVEGRETGLIPNNSEGLFDSIRIRGYPSRIFYAQSALAVGALDLRIPLIPIFRGIGTYPIFFDQFYAFGFAEAAHFPSSRVSITLPSAGFGLTLTSRVLIHIPINLTLEIDHGFRQQFGGKDDAFVVLSLGSLPF